MAVGHTTFALLTLAAGCTCTAAGASRRAKAGRAGKADIGRTSFLAAGGAFKDIF